MDAEPNATEHQVQEVASTEPTDGPSVLESLAADSDNNPALPERRGHETDNDKVSKHTLTLHHAPSLPSFIFWRRPG